MDDDTLDNVRHLPVKRPEGVAELPKRSQIQSDRITRARQRHRCLELAAAGLTIEAIAHEVGQTPRGVRSTIRNQLKKWAEDNSSNLADYRMMKLFELDQLKRAVWPKALRGELDAVREAARLIGMQSDISGATAPQKHEHDHNHSVQLDQAELQRMEAAWMDARPAGLPAPEVENADEIVYDAELVSGAE